MCVQIIIQRIPNRGKTIILMYTVNVHILSPQTEMTVFCNDSVNRKMNYHEIGIINQRERVPKRSLR